MSSQNVQKYLIFFSYLGKHYKGVQSQTRRIPTFETLGMEAPAKEDESIQIQLEKALSRLVPKPKNEIRLGISSRTDSGVNAFINSCQLNLEHPFNGCAYLPNHIVKSANDYFQFYNHNIIFRRVIPVHSLFNVQKHTLSRTYVYRIAVLKKPFYCKDELDSTYLLPIEELYRCYPVCSEQGYLDIEKMKQVCDLFVGTHDFTMFRSLNQESRRKDPQRIIHKCSLKLIRDTYLNSCDPAYKNIDIMEIVVKGKSFLYNQVRRMVGAIIAVGKGEKSVEEIRSYLDEPKKHQWNILMAPPEGLYLADVEYDANDFINPRILNPHLFSTEETESNKEELKLECEQISSN